MQVPESLKAVALYYDSAKVATPPATTDELLDRRQGRPQAGPGRRASTTTSASPARSAASSWTTPASAPPTAGGFADAFKYLADLKAAGATF